MVEPWLLAFAVAFVAIHLLGLGYLLFIQRFVSDTGDRAMPAVGQGHDHRDANADVAGASAGDTASGRSRGNSGLPAEFHADVTDGNAVECSDCGVINDRDYRYCRYCVGELGNPRPRRSGNRSPSGRGLF